MNIPANLFPKFVVMAASISLLTGLASERVEAYQLFTDRNEWLEAVEGNKISSEDFNSIPDGLYFEGELPTDLFRNSEVNPNFPIGVNISQGEVRAVEGRDFIVLADFGREIKGFGLDVNKNSNPDYQFYFRGLDSSGEELFWLPDDFSNGNTEFLGVLAEEGESPIFEAEIFFDPIDRNFGWDNLLIAQSQDDSIAIPENSSWLALAAIFLGTVNFLKRKPAPQDNNSN